MFKTKHSFLSFVASCLLGTSLYASNTLDIKSGWNLYGLDTGITDLNTTFSQYSNSIKTIWAYDSNSSSWKVYSTNNVIKEVIQSSDMDMLSEINPKEGFWVDSYDDITINVQNNTNIDQDISTSGQYNICKSSEFGTISNIPDGVVETFNSLNPFSYVDTGVSVSTSSDYNLFYNHVVYNNDLPSLEMYANIKGEYFGKIEFKSEYLGKPFIVIYDNKRYQGNFEKYNSAVTNLTEITENSDNYPPLISFSSEAISLLSGNDTSLTISYCDQDDDILSFSAESNNTSIATSTTNDNNISFSGVSEGFVSVNLNVDDGVNQADHNITLNITDVKSTISNALTVENQILNNGHIVKMYSNIAAQPFDPFSTNNEKSLVINIKDQNGTTIDSSYSNFNIEYNDYNEDALGLIKIVDANDTLIWESDVVNLYNNSSIIEIDYLDTNGVYIKEDENNTTEYTYNNVVATGDQNQYVQINSSSSETISFITPTSTGSGQAVTFYISINGGSVEAAVITSSDMIGSFKYTDASGNSYIGDFSSAISAGTVDLTN